MPAFGYLHPTRSRSRRKAGQAHLISGFGERIARQPLPRTSRRLTRVPTRPWLARSVADLLREEHVPSALCPRPLVGRMRILGPLASSPPALCPSGPLPVALGPLAGGRWPVAHGRRSMDIMSWLRASTNASWHRDGCPLAEWQRRVPPGILRVPRRSLLRQPPRRVPHERLSRLASCLRGCACLLLPRECARMRPHLLVRACACQRLRSECFGPAERTRARR